MPSHHITLSDHNSFQSSIFIIKVQPQIPKVGFGGDGNASMVERVMLM